MSAKPKKHVCTVENCGKEFSKLSRLVIHIRTHTGERPFVCQFEDCFKSYARQQHLKRHEEISHGSKVENDEESDVPVFSCTIDGCEANFPSKHSLNRHIHRVHLKDVYKCPAIGCSEVFKKHQHLKTHYAVHQEENPYRCPVPECGKSYSFPSVLKRHLKKHEGYRCEEEGCEAWFDKWTLFVKHRKVHHQTVHNCSVCGKTFAQKQWLKEHGLVHREERPVFECPHPQCQREYLSQRNLNAHIKSYHDKQRFACEETECGRTFATKQKLQQHLKLHDPDRPLKPVFKRKKKTQAQKLTGIDKSFETEDRGESGDDFMNLVDVDNSDLELAELQITSGCLGNSVTENSVTDLNICAPDIRNERNCIDEKSNEGNRESVLSSLCSETGTNNITANLGTEKCNKIADLGPDKCNKIAKSLQENCDLA